MSEHYPISGHDAGAIELFLTTSGARQHSGAGGVLDHLQTVGVAALEDYELKRANNRDARRQLADAGYAIAGLPWDLFPNTAQPTSEDEQQSRSYVEPGFYDEAKRALVSRRFRRMHERGNAGVAHVQVLTVYFGTIGRQFDEQPLPRVFALLHLSEPGREFLAGTQHLLAPGSRGLPAPDRMRSHCRFRDDCKYDPHRDVFARAEVAADRLFREAADAWNVARGGQ